MALSRPLKATAFALLVFPLLVGCAAKNTYRLDAVVTETRFATIQNFGTAEIDAARVDSLLMEVADILGVTLDRAVRKARIVVTAPEKIAGLFRAASATYHGRGYAEALYIPRASLVMIPYFDRIILGHELAHYVTDHYLNQGPHAQTQWEAIAERVERKLWATKPAPTKPAATPEAVVVAGGPLEVRSATQ